MSYLSELLFKSYGMTKNKRLRGFIRWYVNRLENGQFYSQTLRKIFKTYHQVEIGMYTHGSCFNVGQIDRHTTIGRYCSIAANVRVFNRNHPMEYKSTHAFFFNPTLGICDKDSVGYSPLKIGHDVWIGDGAIIMPHVKEIGHGAVLAAGCVVNKDVPPYAVIVGNPGRIVRYRFSKEVIQKLLESEWWMNDVEHIKENLGEYIAPYGDSSDKTSDI